MAPESAGGFTAAQAVRTLDELKGYEETLAGRTAGLTVLVWGFVVAGIPLSYQALGWWLEQQGTWGNVAAGFLWAPWVLAGIAFTSMLWSTHAVSVKRAATPGRDWLWSLAFTASFFAIAGAVFLFVGSDANTFSFMGVTVGLFTFVLATVYHFQCKDMRFMLPLYAAGLVILVAGLVLVATGAERTVSAMVTAGVQGLAYFLAGSMMIARG